MGDRKSSNRFVFSVEQITKLSVHLTRIMFEKESFLLRHVRSNVKYMPLLTRINAEDADHLLFRFQSQSNRQTPRKLL